MNPFTPTQSRCQRAFVEEGAFLWSQRTHLVNSLLSGLEALQKLDHKLEAAIEGMLLHPDTSGSICLELIAEDTTGSMSMAVALAILHNGPVLMEQLLETIESNHRWEGECQDTLSWLPMAIVQKFFSKRLPLNNHSMMHRLWLQALQQHKKLPEDIEWTKLLSHASESTLPAIQLAGVKRLTQWIPHLQQHLETNPVWSTWSLLLMGGEVDPMPLLESVHSGEFPAKLGLPVALCAMEDKAQVNWLQQQRVKDGIKDLFIEAMGISGRCEAIDTLIECMELNNSLYEQKQIAYAFNRITGHYPAETETESNSTSHDPEHREQQLAAIKPIDFLPAPDADKMKVWWTKNQHRFDLYHRYREGHLLSKTHQIAIVRDSVQDNRAITALELAANGYRELFPVYAPVWRQYSCVL